MKPSVASTLDAARKAVDPVERLERLVDAWRLSRDPALGDLIDRWVTALTVQRAPPGSASGSFQQAWLMMAADRRTADLGHLFDTIARGNGAHAEVRVKALADFGPNPVIARRITAWLEAAPFDGKNRARCLGPALDVLAACEDPRSTLPLAKATASSARSATVRTVGLKNWSALKALAEKSARWVARAPAGALDGLEPPAAEKRADLSQLWADVYAAPDDVQRRLVLADALQETGDPRGELMGLQLARAADAKPAKREKELLSKYAEQWLGGLGEALRSPVYEGGLLVRGSVKGSLEGLERICADPAWSTVKRLDFPRPSSDTQRALLTIPHLTRLEVVTGLIAPTVYEVLATRPQWAWKAMEVVWSHNERIERLTAHAARLPQVREVALHVTPAEVDAVLAAFPQLTTLGVFGEDVLGPLWRAVSGAKHLRRLMVEQGGTCAVLELETRLLTVYSEWLGPTPFLAPKGVAAVNVVACGTYPSGAARLAETMKQAGHQVTLTKQSKRPAMRDLFSE